MTFALSSSIYVHNSLNTNRNNPTHPSLSGIRIAGLPYFLILDQVGKLSVKCQLLMYKSKPFFYIYNVSAVIRCQLDNQCVTMLTLSKPKFP